MLKRLIKSYFESFKGLPVEIWWLSLITLINRAGTMVIPFLSLYLTKDKHLSLELVGWIMTAFGLGSVCGAYIGGWLTDKIGPYKTMILSLGSSGVFFILNQYADSFWSIAIMIFTVVLLADIFRPASFTALKSYTNETNQTRSTSLIRLAINLGFSVGPAIGGLLIYSAGYSMLFWVDGITSILAMVLLIYVLHPKRSVKIEKDVFDTKPHSAYKDPFYLIFILGIILFAFVFLQYFSTIPYFYSEAYNLSEKSVGILLGFNGLLIFVIEMPIIHYLEKKSSNSLYYVFIGAVFLLSSFLILQVGHHISLLWIGMAFMSVAEVIAFPFANSFALNRSKRGLTGQYMALFTIAFSIAHVFGHNAGFQLINNFGFEITWWFMIIFCLIMSILFYLLKSRDKK
jgi:predicted MFS family arabinose efflux permease